MGHLVLEDHLRLLHLLDDHDLPGFLPAAEPDLAEGAPAYDIDGVEVLGGQFLPPKDRESIRK